MGWNVHRQTQSHLELVAGGTATSVSQYQHSFIYFLLLSILSSPSIFVEFHIITYHISKPSSFNFHLQHSIGKGETNPLLDMMNRLT